MPKCTNCSAENPENARFCQSCGSKLEPDQAPATASSDPPPPAPGVPLPGGPTKKKPIMSRNWWIAAGVIAAAILIIGLIMGPEDENSSSDPSGEDLEFSAYDVCKQFVEDRLKAPGTADFPDFFGDDVTVTAIGDTYTATAHVDSENSFGASLRAPFTCTVTHISGTEFQLADLQLVE